MNPILSVIIPTYGRPEALERTLRALAQQQVEGPFEVIVCDDGSAEADAARLAACLAALGPAYAPRASLRLLRRPHRGPAAARNAGAREAAAELLVFLDDDCAPAPRLLERHLQAHRAAEAGDRRDSADERPELLAVLGHVAWSPDLRVTPFMELVMRGAQFNYGAITDPEHVPFTCFYTANCSLRRASLEAVGWFDESLPPYMEDTEFAYRFTRRGGRIVYRPEAVVHHEHVVELASYLERQRRAGRAAVEVAQRHPELFDLVGAGQVADLTLREQFYTALLRYAFVVGVEEGLGALVEQGRLTGEELRGQFERWVAHWAVRAADEVAEWRARVRALEAEIAARDARLAEVVQAKDAEVALLQAELERIHRLVPVRLYQRLKRWLALFRHNVLSLLRGPAPANGAIPRPR